MREWLKAMRNERNISQKKMSELLKVAQPYYCEIEKGSKQPDMAYSMMEKLAAAFNVSVQTVIDAETAYVAGRRD